MTKEQLDIRKLPCACSAARRVSRAVTHLYDLVLAPTGLKATQFIILHAIAEHGEIAHCMLSREYAASVETLSRRLAAMRKAGWIALRVAGSHQEHLYTLTPEGRRVLAEAEPFWRRASGRLAEAYAGIADIDLDETIRLLDVLTVAAHRAVDLRTTNGPRNRAASAGKA